MIRSRVWRAVVTVAASWPATACRDNAAAPAATVTRVAMTPAIDTLWFVGDTMRVNATPQQASGAAVYRAAITWTSDDPSIIAVDQHGLLTATGTGTTTVHATVDEVIGSATVVAQRWVAVSAGTDRCAITSGAVAYCGLGSVPGVVPFRVSNTLRFTSIAAGSQYACGITTARIAFCWGDNSWGELGDGTLTSSTTPVSVWGALKFSMLAAMAPAGTTGKHTCGLTVDGTAYCWGAVDEGQLGVAILFRPILCGPDGVTSCHPFPFLISDSTFASISAGSGHGCALTSAGFAYCWGDGPGSAPQGPNWEPATIPTSLSFTTIAGKFQHSCALTSTGDAYCWGADVLGKLGYGTGPAPTSFVVQVLGGDWLSISPSVQHTCGLKQDGTAYCWGSNENGMLGDGTTTNRDAPALVAGGLYYVAVAAGEQFNCGITTSGALYCWGPNLPVTRAANPK